MSPTTKSILALGALFGAVAAQDTTITTATLVTETVTDPASTSVSVSVSESVSTTTATATATEEGEGGAETTSMEMSAPAANGTAPPVYTYWNTTVTTAIVVAELTTVCAEPTTLTFNDCEYPVTAGETLVVTNCPCTLTTVSPRQRPRYSFLNLSPFLPARLFRFPRRVLFSLQLHGSLVGLRKGGKDTHT